MKKLLIALCFLPTFVFSQTDDCSSIEFEDIVVLDSSLTKEELYERARLWFANTYKDSKKVLEITDKENGELVGKGAIQYQSKIFVGNAGTRGWIYYTVRVSFKQGRYKYLLSDYYHEANPGNQGAFSFGTITKGFCPITGMGMMNPSKGWQKKVMKEMVEISEERTKLIASSLYTAMKDNSQKDW